MKECVKKLVGGRRMNFYDCAMEVIKEKLHVKDNIEKIVRDIKNANGKVAFFPCNKFFRDLLLEMEKIDVTVKDKIYGCFDKQGCLLSKKHQHVIAGLDWEKQDNFIDKLEKGSKCIR